MNSRFLDNNYANNFWKWDYWFWNFTTKGSDNLKTKVFFLCIIWHIYALSHECDFNKLKRNGFNFIVVWIVKYKREWNKNKFCLDRKK